MFGVKGCHHNTILDTYHLAYPVTWSMEHSQVTGPTTRASAHKAYTLLFGILQVFLCSLQFLACLFMVGFSFSCWVWRLAHSINWADLSFRFGLLIGFIGGSLVSGALFTPTFAYCFAILLFVQSYMYLVEF